MDSTPTFVVNEKSRIPASNPYRGDQPATSTPPGPDRTCLMAPSAFSRLRIAGFKSFAEPQTVEILPGLTGVVGP